MTLNNLNAKNLWQAVLAEMELNLSDLVYKTWLAKTQIKEIVADTIYVYCLSEPIKKRIEKQYLEMLRASIEKITKSTNFTIEFVVGEPTKEQKFEDTPLFQNFKKTYSEDTFYAIQKAGLNPKYTFENYIMGKTNQLAYAIATSIADNPGSQYNPFFVYSGVGLGKTHLVQAIANRILKNNPNIKVVYEPSETFTNELIESIQKGEGGKGNYTLDSFRKKYRNTDVLIIDDVQFIIGKESTQEEFFHTFNELYNRGKQIILASDRPPTEFKDLEARITSRFKSGITADMQSPEFELRVAILRAKRDLSKDIIPNEVLDYLAEVVYTNIRELEGAYLQVLTYSKAISKPATLELAKEALGNNIVREKAKPLNLNHILKTVCNFYDVKQTDIKGKRRTKELVIPRQVAMYLMYDLTGTPFVGIGEFLGGRDHTTVMHGVKKVEQDFLHAPNLKEEIMNIKQYIYQN